MLERFVVIAVVVLALTGCQTIARTILPPVLYDALTVPYDPPRRGAASIATCGPGVIPGTIDCYR